MARRKRKNTESLWLRRLKRSLLGIGFAFIAGFGWLRLSLPDTDGALRLDGITSPILLVRDSEGVPHIHAGNESDAYFALGFAHAQDRLWQMEMQRRIGAGRLSEILGRKALESDRFMRTLGLYRLAEANFANLDAATRAALDSYSAGVNAYIRRLSLPLHPPPPEFLLLAHWPEPWRPMDSLVWARIMALQLGGDWQDELLHLRLDDSLSPEQKTKLWPAPRPSPTTISAPSAPPSASAPEKIVAAKILASLPADLRPRSASNAWAVAGSRSETGYPLLANDPHLGFEMPTLWYLAVLRAPDFEVTGATIPGAPFLVIGHNGHMAWGMTTTGADTMDIFKERIAPQDPTRYMLPDGSSRPFDLRHEIIKVRGGDDQTLVIRATRHGPVISDALGSTEGSDTVLALAATTFLDDDRTMSALYRMNHAENTAQFLDALAMFHAPAQNVTFAEGTGISGSIGFQVAGRIPIRNSAHTHGAYAGWTGEGDWSGFIAFNDLPRSLDPASGQLVNANNRPVHENYPYYLAASWPEGYRAQRILDMLDAESDQRLTLNRLAEMQTDSVSLAAREFLDILAALPDPGGRAREALEILRNWNGVMNANHPAPLIFSAWLTHFDRRLTEDVLPTEERRHRRPRPTLALMALSPNSRLCDDPRTEKIESCVTKASESLETVLGILSQRLGPDMKLWRWGELHQASFRHRILGELPLIGSLFNRETPSDGDDFTVNRGSFSPIGSAGAFRHIHGAGLRAVFDLADLDRSLFMLATGQSGHPMSRYYDNFLARWSQGQTIVLSDQVPSGQADGALTLEPAR